MEERQGTPSVAEQPAQIREHPLGVLPRRRRGGWLILPVSMFLLTAGVAWGIPGIQGFHFRCGGAAAGNLRRETRLGIEMCRGESGAERVASATAQHRQEEDARREANTADATEAEEETRAELQERKAQEEDKRTQEAYEREYRKDDRRTEAETKPLERTTKEQDRDAKLEDKESLEKNEREFSAVTKQAQEEADRAIE